MPRDKDVLTTGEVAKICNVAPRTVSKWFDSGRLKGYRIPGSKDRRIPLNDLIGFMKEHGIPMDGVVTGRPRVLIADREVEVVDTMKRLLDEHTNYDVDVVTSAFEAGLHCERTHPGVVLLDLHLEGGDGRTICAAIRRHEDLQITKVIGMSSRLTDGQAHQLRSAGFDGFLKKPFNIKQVMNAVEDALSIVH